MPPIFDHQKDWIIDIGASDHMSHCRSLFLDLREPPMAWQVRLPTGETIAVEGVGSIPLSKTLTLSNVLFVPTFHYNLLSIPQITSHLSCVVTFSSSNVFFRTIN
ncbi:hypothetical protein I3842_06G011600 [Carya illinoinensis]|uniref:Retrovirus-related Pol polyprotein from transposon TNT 1-94-like beta-barrel domain-containing protein n=1 Tax=Carya illinoinensis TaxID=32201 RepID=A0A922JIX1_CARIL|nr:hypothetical protein I3842_06G011600 [Carya illinoinensis]